MNKTWNEFLAYCLQRNVTETDLLIFVVLGLVGLSLVVRAWVWAFRSFKSFKREENSTDFLVFAIPTIVTAFVGPLLVMGLVNVAYFFI